MPSPIGGGGQHEHHLGVRRTARYFTRGEPASASSLWYACHGYGQLASAFLGYLSTSARDDRLLVAPEALSRFYHDDGRGPIGASWMTREDRDHEIADYVAYLDAIDATLTPETAPGRRRFMLGFSQGVATVTRWLTRGSTPCDGLVLWAGGVAPDLDAEMLAERIRGKPVAIVAGHRDEYVKPEWFGHEQERFTGAGAECRIFQFHGGHRLDRVTLSEVLTFIES